MMMPDMLEGPKDCWLQRYTSNRIGEQEVEQIILALKGEGLVLDNKGTLLWEAFPDKPSVLHQKNESRLDWEEGWGTAIFMAVELQVGYRHFNQPQDTDSRNSVQQLQQKRAEGHLRPNSAVIRHNFVHDVESLFWILMWFATTHIEGPDCMGMAGYLFHSGATDFKVHRLMFLSREEVYCDIMQRFGHEEFLPQELLLSLQAMRNALVSSYQKLVDVSLLDAPYSHIYGLFRHSLQHILRSTPSDGSWRRKQTPEDIRLAPHKIASLKRQREALDVDDEYQPERVLPQIE
ncbi:hypothetical protein NEOLEDRAFT_1243000 [Neolentinus lepideus HHB14362 ss-1]|uniref:Uncharacterized protein n=1 Tax=Neolentinus lepideus HHB14362 ss-1 TaxID=1314782 RepID=A0A165RIC1_9AGAM|nr:hypothetical protein NEOLEDRAFT_1243000 [Neolentinus lepideus HHB14362 ss-1]